MRPVNLMKSETSSSRRLPPVSVLLAALAPVVAIGIVIAAYSYEQGTVTKSKDNLAAAQALVVASRTPARSASPSLLRSRPKAMRGAPPSTRRSPIASRSTRLSLRSPACSRPTCG